MADLFHRRRAKRSSPQPQEPYRREPGRPGPGQQSAYRQERTYRQQQPRRGVAEAPHPGEDLSTHPDVDEMRERYNRVLGGHDVAFMDAPLFLIGLYLAVSPWVVHFTTTQPQLMIHNLIIGAAIAFMAWGFAHTAQRMYGLSWSLCAIGIWLIISSWIVGTHPAEGVIANNAALGGLTILMGLACAVAAAKARRGRAHGSSRSPAPYER